MAPPPKDKSKKPRRQKGAPSAYALNPETDPESPVHIAPRPVLTVGKQPEPEARFPFVEKGHSKFTLERAEVVLSVLASGRSIGAAAAKAEVTRLTVLNWRKAHPDFDQLCVEAIECGIDRLEDEARRRAEDGIEKGVWHQGELVGVERVYSDTLLVFMLRAKRQIYRNSIDVSGPNGGPQEHDVNVSPRELLSSRIASIAERSRAGGGSGGSDGQPD